MSDENAPRRRADVTSRDPRTPSCEALDKENLNLSGTHDRPVPLPSTSHGSHRARRDGECEVAPRHGETRAQETITDIDFRYWLGGDALLGQVALLFQLLTNPINGDASFTHPPTPK